MKDKGNDGRNLGRRALFIHIIGTTFLYCKKNTDRREKREGKFPFMIFWPE